MTVVVGAYALTWGRSLPEQAAVIRSLAAEPVIGGLEVPWSDGLDTGAYAQVVCDARQDWTVTVTTMPGTMARLSQDPRFGLASADEKGRVAAVSDLARLRDDVARLNDTAGRAVVSAVQLCSAPSSRDGENQDAEALARSLEAIASADWGGALVLLEHADSAVVGRDPAKGFLALETEISVITERALPVGILVNWGRSAIELRSGGAVVEHITRARDAGLLRGLIFSGASAEASEYGEAWGDQHAPPQPYLASSLLNDDLMRVALQAAGHLDVTGVKISSRGQSMQEATAMLADVARRVSEMSGVRPAVDR